MHVTDVSLMSGDGHIKCTSWRWLKGYPVDQRKAKVGGIHVQGSYHAPVPKLQPVKTEIEDHEDRPQLSSSSKYEDKYERNDGRPDPSSTEQALDAPLRPSSTAASSAAHRGFHRNFDFGTTSRKRSDEQN